MNEINSIFCERLKIVELSERKIESEIRWCVPFNSFPSHSVLWVYICFCALCIHCWIQQLNAYLIFLLFFHVNNEVLMMILLLLAAAAIRVLLPLFQNHSTVKKIVLCVVCVQECKMPCQNYSKSSKKNTNRVTIIFLINKRVRIGKIMKIPFWSRTCMQTHFKLIELQLFPL